MSDAEKNFEVPAYDAEEIETRWQAAWDAEELYKTEESPEKPKKYVLEMFPYPSGDLHMGHARNYTIGDAMARQAACAALTCLHPMGYDAFGLPAENAAIKHNTQASVWTQPEHRAGHQDHAPHGLLHTTTTACSTPATPSTTSGASGSSSRCGRRAWSTATTRR